MNSERRALVLTKNDFTAERDGGSKRTAALIRSLEAQGFVVDWIAAKPFAFKTSEPVRRSVDVRSHVRALASVLRSGSLSSVKWYSRKAISLVADLCRSRNYELAVVDHTQLVPMGVIARATVRCASTHNVESELLQNYANSRPGRMRETAARYEASRLRRIESDLVDVFDIVVTVSDRDGTIMASDRFGFRADLVTAPNGVDEVFFEARGPRERRVVFIGHLGWRPNIDAAEWLAETVWPEVAHNGSDLSLTLVGKSPSAAVRRLAGPTVEVAGDVESVVPHLISAQVATAPLLSAGGTRIKILEALAAGTPVVSTSLGALGLEHLAGDHLLIADTPDHFARAIVEMASHERPRDVVRDLVQGYRWTETMSPVSCAVQRALAAAVAEERS